MDQGEYVFWTEGEEWPLHLLPAPLVSLILSEREVGLMAGLHDKMAISAAKADDGHAVTFHRARAAFMRSKAAEALLFHDDGSGRCH